MKLVQLKIYLCGCLFLFNPAFSIHAQSINSPEQVVQENLERYNARDLEGFMSYFSDSVALYSLGKVEPIAKGKQAVQALYAQLFEASPNLHSTILHRAVIGNRVIDHESITGRKGSLEAVEMVVIYEVSNHKINTMRVIKE
jgi:hypothetical protein